MSDLFLDHVHKLSFEKIAMPVKLSDDPSAWQREVASEIYKQLPYLGEYAVNVVLDRVDAERGYAYGQAKITNKSEAPAPEQEELPEVVIPIIVKERLMAPLDVFMDGKGVFPLSESRLREHLFRANTFETSTRKPTDKGMTDQLYPPSINGGLNGVDMGMGKMAGIPAGMETADNPYANARRKAHALGQYGAAARSSGTAQGVPDSHNVGFSHAVSAGGEAADAAKRQLPQSSAPVSQFQQRKPDIVRRTPPRNPRPVIRPPRGSGVTLHARPGSGTSLASLAKLANSAEQGRQQMVRSMKADAAANPTWYGSKLADLDPPKPPLMDAIGPTIPESEADELVDSVCNDPALAVAAASNPAFSQAVTKVAMAPRASIQKTASALVDSIKPTVVQFVKLASGDFRVKWANVNAFAPQEGVVPPDQANSMAGADLGASPEGSTITVGTEKAKKTQLKEQAYVQIDEPAVYQVHDQESGEDLVGHVMSVVDFDMQPLEMFVFVSADGRYGCQDEIAGIRQKDDGQPPTQQPMPLEQAQGSGCLFYDVAGAFNCLLPMTIQNTSQGPDGSMQVHAESVFGEPLILSTAPGLQAIQQIGENEYAVPDFVQWCPLQGEPLFLTKKPIEIEQKTQAQQAPSTVDVGSTAPGEFSMEGQPLAKVAREHRQFLKTAEAEFLLVGMGMNPFDARKALAQAQVHGHCKVAGLLSITPLADLHKTMVKKAAKTLSNFPYELRRNLVKEAAVIDDAETADKVLAMNFINPENIGTFASYLPELDTAMCKLAEMLIACRMGMRNVDEGAVERCMKNGEQVIDGLKALQQREQV